MHAGQLQEQHLAGRNRSEGGGSRKGGTPHNLSLREVALTYIACKGLHSRVKLHVPEKKVLVQQFVTVHMFTNCLQDQLLPVKQRQSGE